MNIKFYTKRYYHNNRFSSLGGIYVCASIDGGEAKVYPIRVDDISPESKTENIKYIDHLAKWGGPSAKGLFLAMKAYIASDFIMDEYEVKGDIVIPRGE